LGEYAVGIAFGGFPTIWIDNFMHGENEGVVARTRAF